MGCCLEAKSVRKKTAPASDVLSTTLGMDIGSTIKLEWELLDLAGWFHTALA